MLDQYQWDTFPAGKPRRGLPHRTVWIRGAKMRAAACKFGAQPPPHPSLLLCNLHQQTDFTGREPHQMGDWELLRQWSEQRPFKQDKLRHPYYLPPIPPGIPELLLSNQVLFFFSAGGATSTTTFT